MCRYAFQPYKPHYACFSCRKSFKRRLRTPGTGHLPERPARCPQCGLLMANMGMDFAPPKKTDIKAWKTLESLYAVGVTFHSCGCSGPGWRPREPIELVAFLEARLGEYEASWARAVRDPDYLEPLRARGEEADRAAAIDYWRDRVEAVRGELERARS